MGTRSVFDNRERLGKWLGPCFPCDRARCWAEIEMRGPGSGEAGVINRVAGTGVFCIGEPGMRHEAGWLSKARSGILWLVLGMEIRVLSESKCQVSVSDSLWWVWRCLWARAQREGIGPERWVHFTPLHVSHSLTSELFMTQAAVESVKSKDFKFTFKPEFISFSVFYVRQ